MSDIGVEELVMPPLRHLSRLHAFSLNGLGLQGRSLRSRPLTIEIFYPGITSELPGVTQSFPGKIIHF